jgi:hypothetical protein
MRRTVIFAVVLSTVLAVGAAVATPPLPEPNFTGFQVRPPSACAGDPSNPYEAQQYQREGWGSDLVRYGTACQRLHFAFGPIKVAPGQNDVLIEPVTIEKPAYDGYIVRFRPDLVDELGNVPGIDQVHLHHGTWITFTNNYGSGPFFASGEEKTIGNFPRGYGFPILKQDSWELLHMVHNQGAAARVVYITYDIDYIAKDVADSPAFAASYGTLVPIYPIWLDVRPSSYPVFNIQRNVNGAAFGETAGECQWPRENCAAFDPWGIKSLNQGIPTNIPGKDWEFPAIGENDAGGNIGRIKNFHGGTLIGIGGHLHPGGITNDIDLVRPSRPPDDQVRRIFTSQAQYWDRTDDTKIGDLTQIGNSWDFSMTVTGVPYWAVHVEPGDKLRSNATYDNTIQATYENMGIAVTFIAPDVKDPETGLWVPTAPGVNPFTATFNDSTACAIDPVTGLAVGTGMNAFRPGDSTFTNVLCELGVPTHGHMAEVEAYGGSNPLAITTNLGAHTNLVTIANFNYLPGDFSKVNLPGVGVPTVGFGESLTFVNADLSGNIYHTITSCKFPCSASAGTAYPIADGRSAKLAGTVWDTSAGKDIDFDSAELGVSPNFGPAKGSIPLDERLVTNFGAWTSAVATANLWRIDLTSANGFEPNSVYSYFCRIHPFMRGYFYVTS